MRFLDLFLWSYAMMVRCATDSWSRYLEVHSRTVPHLSSTAAAAAGAEGVFRGTHPNIEFGWCTEEPSSFTGSQRPVVIFFRSRLALTSADTV